MVFPSVVGARKEDVPEERRLDREGAYQDLRQARDAVREPNGMNEEREDVDGEGLEDGVLAFRHQPGHEPASEVLLEGQGPEPRLRFGGCSSR